MKLNPPHTNGIEELTNEQILSIKAKLQVIVDGFIPSDEQEFVNTFYIVSTYNRQNVDSPINGDTAEYVLYQYVEEVEEDVSEVVDVNG
jgi:hypothetical protein